MIDVARLGLAVVLDVDGGAVLHVLLRNVEHVAVGIVSGDARERPVGGPLQPPHARVARAHAIEDRLYVLDLDAEMIETGGASSAAGIDVEPHIAVADRDRAPHPRLGRGSHAEDCLVELGKLCVVITDDGDVIDFRKHVVISCAGRAGDAAMFRPGEAQTSASAKTIRALPLASAKAGTTVHRAEFPLSLK